MAVVSRCLPPALLLGLSVLTACGGNSNSGVSLPPPPPQFPPQAVTLNFLGRFSTGQFDAGAAASLSWYGEAKQALVANRAANRVDVLSLSTPASPQRIAQIDASGDAATALGHALGQVSAVAVFDAFGSVTDKDRIAVTVLGIAVDAPGAVAIYNASDRSLITVLATGVGPGAVSFSQDGQFVITADAGEPAADYSVDPEGSISVVNLSPVPTPPATTAPPSISVLGFAEFNVTGITPIPTTSRESEILPGVRVIEKPAPLPVATRAQDFEPKSVSTGVNARAYVSLQKNNAFATVALLPARIESILPFGTRDYNVPGNSLEASDLNNPPVLRNQPVKGYFQPGAIAVFRNNVEVLILTANTGAPRVLPSFDERARVADLTLDPVVFPNAAELQQATNLGRLQVSATEGNAAATSTVPADADHEALLAYGTRSFSIFRVTGTIANDSANDFERITAERLGSNFNSAANANGSGGSRSDDSGPAPSALALGQIDGATFAFIGLHEVGGIMVYALDNNLLTPRFIDYKTERNFNVPVATADTNGDGFADTNPEVGDLGPDSMVFVPISASPTADSLLIVGNSVSGTTSVYAVRPSP